MMLLFKVEWITNLPYLFKISMSHKLLFSPDCESNAVINALENELAKAVNFRARDHNLKLITSDGNQVSKVITCCKKQRSQFHEQPNHSNDSAN